MKRRRWLWFVGVLVGLAHADAATGAQSGHRLVLVQGGRPAATIVVARQATRAARFAAYELQWHIRKITGATLPIANDKAKTQGVRILVGASRATPKLDLKPQEYLVRFLPNTLLLVGRDAPDRSAVIYDADDPFCFRTWPGFFTEHATCYAVYDFLERYCGVRWFMPNELGLVCPKTKTLTVSGADVRRSPAFLCRQPSWLLGNSEGYGRATRLWNPKTHAHKHAAMDRVAWTGLNKRWAKNGWKHLHAKRAEVRKFLYRMRAGGEPYACNHSFYGYYDRYWEPSKHAKTAKLFERRRPEFFAQGYPGRPPQMCFSNKPFVDQVIADARAYYDGKGVPHRAQAAGEYFALVPQDNGRWCKCAPCQAQLNASARTGMFSNGWASDYFFTFANTVAREVARTHPDKTLSTLAYASYAYPPTRFKLEPNISVQFCLHMRNVYSRKLQENDLTLLRTWAEREKGRPFFVWLYYCFPKENAQNGRWHCFPGFFAHQIARSFKLYHAMGVRGMFFNGFGQDVEAYVSFQLMNDPSRDVDAMLDEYFTKLYGPAAEPIKKMYLRIEEIYSTPKYYPPGFDRHQTAKVAWEHLGTEAHMAELAKWMHKARSASLSDLQRRRVTLWEQGVWDYMTAGRKDYLVNAWYKTKGNRLPKALWVKQSGKGIAIDRWLTETGGRSEQKPTVRVAHDGKALHIEMQDATPGGSWEILLARRHELPLNRIVITADGRHDASTLVQRGPRPWASGAKVVVGGDMVRVTLPFGKLLTPGGMQSGWHFFANFVRHRPGQGAVVWTPMVAGSNDVRRLGRIEID
jgi:uncharacterized protein DUF4838